MPDDVTWCPRKSSSRMPNMHFVSLVTCPKMSESFEQLPQVACVLICGAGGHQDILQVDQDPGEVLHHLVHHALERLGRVF